LSMSVPILAAVTDRGRQRLADMLVTGRGFIIESFILGSGGHDPENPTITLTPDPTITSVPFASFGPKALAQLYFISPTCPAFDAYIDYLEGVGELSNIGLISRVITSPYADDPQLGVEELFAIGNFPLRTKLDSERLTFRVSIQF
jgi:hypothetical protein